jgi:hypothetical protein
MPFVTIGAGVYYRATEFDALPAVRQEQYLSERRAVMRACEHGPCLDRLPGDELMLRYLDSRRKR